MLWLACISNDHWQHDDVTSYLLKVNPYIEKYSASICHALEQLFPENGIRQHIIDYVNSPYVESPQQYREPATRLDIAVQLDKDRSDASIQEMAKFYLKGFGITTSQRSLSPHDRKYLCSSQHIWRRDTAFSPEHQAAFNASLISWNLEPSTVARDAPSSEDTKPNALSATISAAQLTHFIRPFFSEYEIDPFATNEHHFSEIYCIPTDKHARGGEMLYIMGLYRDTLDSTRQVELQSLTEPVGKLCDRVRPNTQLQVSIQAESRNTVRVGIRTTGMSLAQSRIAAKALEYCINALVRRLADIHPTFPESKRR